MDTAIGRRFVLRRSAKVGLWRVVQPSVRRIFAIEPRFTRPDFFGIHKPMINAKLALTMATTAAPFHRNPS